MQRLFQSLLLVIARATDRELAKHVQYLKAENEILKAKIPGRFTITPKERSRLVKFGRELGTAIRELITIVSPRTFLRWLHDAEGPRKLPRRPSRKPGRPRTPDEIRELVLRLARETGWGYTRILGELKKLGVRKICRSTVINILKAEGLDPCPKRGEETWGAFIKRHAETLWSCDFFSVKIWTMRGMVEIYALFFINVQTRKVFVSGMTPNPDGAWVAQQARNFSMHLDGQGVPARRLLRDNDQKFCSEFDAILEGDGVDVVRVAIRSPNLNAVAERYVQT